MFQGPSIDQRRVNLPLVAGELLLPEARREFFDYCVCRCVPLQGATFSLGVKPNRMRTFHLVLNLDYGGLQKVVQLLAVRQIQSGHSVTIGCWTYACDHPEAESELEAAGVRVVYLRRAADGGLSHGRMSSLQKLKAHQGEGNADILHVHNPFGYYIYGALAARVAGRTKTLNTIHATVMFDRPGFGRKGRAKFRIAAMLTHGLVSLCAESDAYLAQAILFAGQEVVCGG